MPTKPIFQYAGGILGCAEASRSNCTKCYCGFGLASGTCKLVYDYEIPNCRNMETFLVKRYSDNTCTTGIKDYCAECIKNVK